MSKRAEKRQQARIEKKQKNIKGMQKITTPQAFTKEEMERLLKTQNVRIMGVLYDVPVFQIKRYLEEKKFGMQVYTFHRSEDQTLKEDIY